MIGQGAGAGGRKHHHNIALDTGPHLDAVDHIVSDLSEELIHKPRHSPKKDLETEAHQVEIMEGFGMRNIALSASTRNMNLTIDNEELDLLNEKSDWKTKTTAIQKRPRGWMMRFQKDMRKGGRIEQTPEHDNVLHRSKSFRSLEIASAFGFAAHLRKKKPVKPNIDMVNDLQPFSDRLLKSSLCVICFQIVGIDGEQKSCAHCPVVAHGSCISHNSPLCHQSIGDASSRDADSFDNLCDSSRILSKSIAQWTCPFCIHEVKLGNKYRQERYTAATTRHAESGAILLLQSHVRMFPIKKQFKQLVSAAITLQRFHRSQHLRRALIRERLLQRRPLRLSIHEVTIFYENPNYTSTSYLPMRDNFSNETVENTANNTRVFCQFGTNHLPRNIASKLVPTASLTDMASLPLEAQSLKATNTELRKTAMLNLLQLGHMMEPQSTTPPMSDPKAAAFPPNSVFLTTTVLHFQHGRHQQLYRDDVPLLPLQDSSMNLKRADFAGHFKVLDEVSHVVETGFIRSMPPGSIKTMKIYPPRSMVVLPSCPADVTVYLTVSKVTEWPRACIIGQSMLRAEHLSIWRQCVCLSQNISTKDIEEEPKNDTTHRLQLFRASATAPLSSRGATAKGPATGRGQERTSLPDISRLSIGSCSGHNTARSGKIFDSFPKDIWGGQVLWSFVSTPPIGNMFGHLHFMATVSQLSYKKKSWCVLIDGQLLVYARASDIKPKEVIPLKHCYYSVVEKVIIKIFKPKEPQTWFFMCNYPNKRDMWLDAFKENSMNQGSRLVANRKQRHSDT